MATLGRWTARVAGLTALLGVACFHDAMPDLQPAGTGTGLPGSSTGAPGSTGADTTGIVTSGTTVEPATTAEPATTSGTTTAPATTGPALDMGGPARFTCPTDQDLVACYLFESGWNMNALIDGGPGGLDGEMSGATMVDGYRGSAAGTSTDTAISVADPALARTADWSITAWVRPDVLPTNYRSGVLDRDGDYGIFVLKSGVAHCAGEVGVSGTKALPLGTWSHVTCLFQQGHSLRIYVNGQLEAEAPWMGLVPVANAPLVIANDSPPSPDEALIGAVDEVTLWRKLLTKDDICALAGVGC